MEKIILGTAENKQNEEKKTGAHEGKENREFWNKHESYYMTDIPL